MFFNYITNRQERIDGTNTLYMMTEKCWEIKMNVRAELKKFKVGGNGCFGIALIVFAFATRPIEILIDSSIYVKLFRTYY